MSEGFSHLFKSNERTSLDLSSPGVSGGSLGPVSGGGISSPVTGDGGSGLSTLERSSLTRGPGTGNISASGLLSSGGSGLLLSLLFGVTVEEHINHDVPRSGAGDGATETEDLTGQHPVGKTNGVLGAVVGGDGNVDVTEGGLGIGESDNGDVDVRSLLDGLVVGQGVGDDDQTGLLEGTGDIVGEGTGGEATGNGLGTGVRGELQSGTLTVGAGRDDADISGVLDGDDDTGSENDLLPGLSDVDDVETYLPENRLGYLLRWCPNLVDRRAVPPGALQLLVRSVADFVSSPVFRKKTS